MTSIIRPATSDDADAIVRIIENCFGDEVESQHVQSVIKEDDHATFVAEVDGKVIGFVDNFITIAQDGTRCCELDLLGVDIHHRGQGAGKKLIAASTQAGKDFGVSTMRVLVSATNIEMYHAMLKMEYEIKAVISRLYISDAEGKPTTPPSSAHLIPVNTLSYRGIWLEGELTKGAIDAAKGIRTKYSWDVIGVVVPAIKDDLINLVEAEDFKLVGTYYRWFKSI